MYRSISLNVLLIIIVSAQNVTEDTEDRIIFSGEQHNLTNPALRGSFDVIGKQLMSLQMIYLDHLIF